MPHDTPLISTIVMGLVLAFIFGAIANKLRMPPLVGYLVAGVLAGPYTPGFVADQGLAPELAEIGVILLMFGVGLHFSLKDLLSVRFIAVPGALVQIAFATLLGWGLGELMGWSLGGSLVFGLALSVASTVVLLKALQERRLVETERGKIAVGWLIVEDLAMVLALVLIPAAASISGDGHGPVEPLSAAVNRMFGLDLGIGGIIGMTLLKVALFVALMLVFGRRVIPWILHRTAHTGSRELFRLGVLAIALGVAFGAAKLFGVSLALGAFFAGMVLAESELSHRAAQESLPLRDAFAVLFFVSVGMLFDPSILLEHPLLVLATVFIIVVGKSAAAFLIVLAFRKPLGTALTISASLAQIGEFSFILAAMGVELGMLPEQGRDLILAGAIISIILNPLVFYGCGRLKGYLGNKTRLQEEASAQVEAATAAAAQPEKESEVPVIGEERDPGPSTLTGHVVVVGYGRVGSIVGQNLLSSGIPFLVIEDTDKRVIDLRERRIEAISGNAASGEVLAFANLAAARSLVIAIPNAFEACSVAEQARSLNPSILIVARAHSDAEVDELTRYGADTVIMGEREIALGMVDRLRQVHHDRPHYEDVPSADKTADTLVTARE
ncbi:YbaL family putative K(+) efflux transporter [Rhizobium tumorigenes]|uniref:YbaL family putative K(+) efflux transporter n=1 Tax=Rhizobium tumorigenes TaxID=2041385 RepID=A0AAF1KQJ5_9HYPH|nr:YbaL family putative K(+) efflux transporter [Rhizobium tumorigenes]WFR95772.1 YbaL family putative K(+) efflux transporter [Rhizobium tumorigenes]